MMEQFMPWVASIVVAIITGVFSYLGVVKASKASHDQTIAEVRNEQEKQSLLIEQQINSIKADIKRLETKQDKHNSLIERTYKLEQKVEDIEKRIN